MTLAKGAGRAARNPLLPALLTSLWLATAANWPLWRSVFDASGLHGWPAARFVAGLGLMIAGLYLAVLALGAWRGLIRPLCTLAVLVAAAGAHYIGRYGIVIDRTMMVNLLQTNPGEASDLVDPALLGSLLLLAGPPLWWIWRTPLQRLSPPSQALRNGAVLLGALAVAGVALLLNFGALSATLRHHRAMRYMINPANTFVALGRIAVGARAHDLGPPQPIGADATLLPAAPGVKPPLLLVVVGETARADRFSLNGYARITNPMLAERGAISFRQVSSCGTSTAVSVPCMFSALGQARFLDREREQENLLDLLQRAGLAVLWIDNQAGCKGVCDRVPHAQTDDLPEAVRARLCQDGECLDEALLVGLDERLAALPAERRARGVVLVMHQMGSHGPAYDRRSPATHKPFQPECHSRALQDCTQPALDNVYDNSIAYTDRMLARAIDWLGTQSGHYAPRLLYLSDHGESLGEGHIYLHGMPLALAPREQTHVPLLLWLPPDAATQAGCLRAQRDRPLSHDHLFHTVLGLVGVRSAEYRPALDLSGACRGVAVAASG